MKIVTIENKNDAKFLRRKTTTFDFNKFHPAEIREIVKNMRRIMKEANGIGLSANQAGLNHKFFIVQVPNEKGSQKFYAIFNPAITKASKETTALEEGCLSVPNQWGIVSRPDKVVLEGLDTNGKRIKIKAWGLLARVFQHEVDHLNGKLFTDKAKKVQVIS